MGLPPNAQKTKYYTLKNYTLKKGDLNHSLVKKVST